MNSLFKRWFRLQRSIDPEMQEKVKLFEEIRQAQKEWRIAQERLNYVKDKEQVDYVIYLLEAAEKRYEMLLHQAKKMNLNVLELRSEKTPDLHSEKVMGG